jgi:predicted aspartyl protease
MSNVTRMARLPRKPFLALWCAAMFAPGAAQDVAVPGVGPPSAVAPVVDVATTKPEDFVYVATTRPDRIGRVMVPVFVNDIGPFAFLIDTGASSSVLAPRLAARLKLTAHPTRNALLRGITGSEVVPTVLVDKISAGGITLTNRHLPVVEPRVFADADGIFGADVFGRGCLTVEFKAARVSIRNSKCLRRRDEMWEEVPAQLRFGGLPIVTARIGNVRVAGIIDTGAERSLGNPALLAALGLEEAARDPATLIQVYAATSQLVYGNVFEAPKLRIGGIQIDRLVAVFGPFDVFRLWEVEREPALVIGMDILGSTDGLMIDFERQQVRLLPHVPDGTVLERRATGRRAR